ncbi:hypothetical protein T439DRAFT_325130 [Meredithblackwellia eburnea MCA 4105]
MHFLATASTAAAIFATAVTAAPATTPATLDNLSLAKRFATPTGTLADGSYYQSGSISAIFRWQSSGQLYSGGCLPKYRIKQYETAAGMLESTTKPARLLTRSMDPEDLAAMYDDDLDSYFEAFPEQLPSELSKRQVTSNCGGGGTGTGNGTTSPPAPRQRIEFLSWPGAVAGTTYTYQWSTYLVNGVVTTNHFFHMWQILRRDACGGPVITLDAKGGKAVISDLVRGCVECTSIPISQWVGKTVRHVMTVTFGINGAINYRAYDILKPQSSLLTYQATGDMGSSTSIKFGMYRAVYPGNSDARSFVGDYVQTKH